MKRIAWLSRVCFSAACALIVATLTAASAHAQATVVTIPDTLEGTALLQAALDLIGPFGVGWVTAVTALSILSAVGAFIWSKPRKVARS